MRDIRKLLESDDFNQSKIGLVHYMDAKGEERPNTFQMFSVSWSQQFCGRLLQVQAEQEMPMYCFPKTASRDGGHGRLHRSQGTRAPSLDLSLSFFPSKTMCPRASFAHERGNMTHALP